MILVLASLVHAERVELPHLFGFAVVLGCLTARSQPPSQTYVFDIVGRARIQSAVAINSAGIGLGMMMGPGLAGVLVAGVDVGGSWLTAAIGLALAAALLVLIPIRGRSSDVRSPALRDLVEGFRFVSRQPPVALALLVCAMSFFNAALSAMRPVFARHVLDVGSQGMGLMAASMGLGNLVGALVATTLPEFKRPGLAMAYAMFGFGLTILLYSLAFSLAYVMVIEFIAELCAPLWQIPTFSGLQRSVPEEMRGRVMGILFMVIQFALVGSVFVGRLADGIGDQQALAVFGVLPTIAMSLIFVWGGKTLARLGEPTDSARGQPAGSRASIALTLS